MTEVNVNDQDIVDAVACPPSYEDVQHLIEPFQFPDADVILRTSIGAEFHVHTLILSHASPVFKDKFASPSERLNAHRGSLPVFEVPEDPQTMHDLLTLVYHTTADNLNLQVEDLEFIHRLLLATRKYQMENLQTFVRTLLLDKIPSNPIRVFAIACLAAESEIAHTAAGETLKLPYTDLLTCDVPEFNRLRAETFRKLLNFHHESGKISANVIRSFRSPECPVPHHVYRAAYLQVGGSSMDCRSFWWGRYLQKIEQTSLFQPILPDYKSTQMVQGFCDAVQNCRKCSPVACLKLIELGERIEEQIHTLQSMNEMVCAFLKQNCSMTTNILTHIFFRYL